jgi:predicted acetyltransferase
MFRRLEETDHDAVVAIREVSFGSMDEAARESMREQLAAGGVFGLESGGAVAALTRLSVVDHWFGGRRVPCQHVGGVAVPPEHRGRGVALALMRAVIERGIADGVGLSLLYPATTALYRRCGWELAGTYARYQIDARLAPALGPALRPATDEDWAAIRACHEATGRALNGPAVGDDRRWARLRRASFAYVLDAPGGGVEAYVVYDQSRTPGDWQFTLAVDDWGATTPDGLAALLGFIGRHGTIGKDATLAGSVPHPWHFLTPEQDLHHTGGMLWMARGLDLPSAVAARGFPPGLTFAVAFAVNDPLVPAAGGPWRLEIADGAGKLVPAASADVLLDARAVGPLYTGFTSPAQLALAGLVAGPPAALALLGAAFAGPPPVLLEFF